MQQALLDVIVEHVLILNKNMNAKQKYIKPSLHIESLQWNSKHRVHVFY